MSNDVFNRDWMISALCRSYPSEWWFPTLPGRNGKAQAEKAAQICVTCPVLAECREYREATRPSWGVWGAIVVRDTVPADMLGRSA